MSDTVKTFGIWVAKMDKADAIPMTPHVKITLEQWGVVANGIPTVTPQLVNEAEVDAYIQALKADLDAVAIRAKAAIRRAHRETDAIIVSRNSKSYLEIQTETLPELERNGLVVREDHRTVPPHGHCAERGQRSGLRTGVQHPCSCAHRA